MQYVKWLDEKYSVNIQLIDDQHKKLVGIINEVFEAKLKQAGKGIISSVLNRLVDYTKTHFTGEEQLMREHGFPGLEAHRTAHAAFVSKIAGFSRDFDNNEDSLTEEMLDFLKEWLLKHIMETDKVYAAFLNDKGIF